MTWTGTIPTEIGYLRDLELLSIENANFTTTIPNELYQLTKLEQLQISHSHISGTISPLIGGLTNLKQLDLSGNAFTGSTTSASLTPLPTEICLLTNLESFRIDGQPFRDDGVPLTSSVWWSENCETAALP